MNCSIPFIPRSLRPGCLIALLLLLGNTLHAQINVGSSTAPNTGAMLEVSGTTKGVLMPRVSLTSTTTWGLDGTQTAGMTVYNTNASITSGNETYLKHPDGKGVYYWDGTGWVAGGASTFGPPVAPESDVVFVDVNNPNTGGAVFYTETDDNDAPVNNNTLKSQTTSLYVAANGSTWVWNGSAYVTKNLPKPSDHDWYIAKTTAAPTNIYQKAYAMGARGIGTDSPAYLLDVRQNRVSGNTPVTNAMVANFQNKGGNVALRMGTSGGRFYLGRTVNSYPGMPANTIFMGQHISGAGAKIAFGDGFGTTTPSVDMLIDPGTGNVGIGITAPVARLDVSGTGDSTASLALRNGSATAGFTNNQILFGYNGSNNYQHAVKTRHHNGQKATNAIDFFVWNQGVDAATTPGSKQVMTLDGTGNVGIGTTAPDDRLTVIGGTVNVAADKHGFMLGQRIAGMFRNNADMSGGQDVNLRAPGAMVFAADANNDISGPQFQGFTWGHGDTSGSGANFKEHMRLTSTGFLGINDTDPDARLTIRETAAPVSSADAQVHISATNPNKVAAIQMGTGGNATLIGQNGNNTNGGLLADAAYWAAPAGGHDFQIITSGLLNNPAPTAALTVKLNGDIGIGTATPHAPLQFVNGVATNTVNRRLVLWENGDNEHEFFGFGINPSALRYQTGSPISDHVFYSSSSASASDELMRIKGTGNVGIGTSNPTSKLNVGGTIEAYVGATRSGNMWDGTSSEPGAMMAASATDGWFAVQRQIGATAGWAGYFTRNAYSAGKTGFIQFNINGNMLGSIHADAANSTFYGTTSDIRLKENVRGTSMGLTDVMKIEVRDYNYKIDENKTPQTGFIAQQLYTVYPQAVTPGGEDVAKNAWTVDYGKLTPLLTKAIQDQQAEIELLRAEIAELKKALKH